ncbi:hypothetical protein QTG56_14685 [Rossellomorea sp. AcN35-11]|nr:hypothetical protein QTG56_14685 [Rossellomorea sp. AcN35-11]
MSKKITWLVTGIITAILICATIIGMTQPKDAEPIEKVQRKDWSKYPGLELETKTKETDLYTSSISYLITEDKQINKTIKDWISSEKEQFMNQMYENKSILNTDHRANITITVDTHQMEKHLYSVEFTSYQFAGGSKRKREKENLQY